MRERRGNGERELKLVKISSFKARKEKDGENRKEIGSEYLHVHPTKLNHSTPIFDASSTSKATTFPQWSENISTTDVAYKYFDLT
jgi:hypothetical protein